MNKLLLFFKIGKEIQIIVLNNFQGLSITIFSIFE